MVSKWETNIVSNDWHIPYHDKKSVELFLYVVKKLHPEIITINGDMLDFYKLSRFTQDPSTPYSLQSELDVGYNYLKRLRQDNPKATIYFIDGNHEYRLSKFLMDKAPELYGLRTANSSQPVHSIDNLLRFGELNIKRISTGNKESYLWYGNTLMLGHFNKVNKHSGYTARHLLEDKHMSLVQGHTHRLGSSYKTVRIGNNKHRVIVAYENGCLCGLNPEYVLDPNWQQGFSVIKKKRNCDRFSVQQIPIVDYTCFYGETEFSYDKIKKRTDISLSSVQRKNKQKKSSKV